MPIFLPSFEVTPFTQRDEISLRNTRDNKLSYGVNQKSLSHLGSDLYRVLTDTKLALACKNCRIYVLVLSVFSMHCYTGYTC